LGDGGGEKKGRKKLGGYQLEFWGGSGKKGNQKKENTKAGGTSGGFLNPPNDTTERKQLKSGTTKESELGKKKLGRQKRI